MDTQIIDGLKWLLIFCHPFRLWFYLLPGPTRACDWRRPLRPASRACLSSHAVPATQLRRSLKWPGPREGRRAAICPGQIDVFHECLACRGGFSKDHRGPEIPVSDGVAPRSKQPPDDHSGPSQEVSRDWKWSSESSPRAITGTAVPQPQDGLGDKLGQMFVQSFGSLPSCLCR